MQNSVYYINKGINRPVEFKGIKAQYIWWLGGGFLILLILFSVLYIIGVNTVVILVVISGSGVAWFYHVTRISRKYGQHGMMKLMAKRLLPGDIKISSRYEFIGLCKKS